MRVGAINLSGLDNHSYADSQADNQHLQLEEYEKLFQIMNGPIENLVNFSREQQMRNTSYNNRNKSMKRPLTVRMEGNKRAQTAVGGEKPPIGPNYGLQVIPEIR